MTPEDHKRCEEICASVTGYSRNAHYSFFKGLLSDTSLKSLLILGVYHGRDICFMLDILHRHHPGRQFSIVGVDKFSDTACADWPVEQRPLKWRAAGYGEPPSLESAVRNTTPLEHDAEVVLYERDDAEFLLGAPTPFDVIYFDTAHDKKTLLRQIQQSRPWQTPETVLCGDDFRDVGTWGVVSAVRESFMCYTVYYDYIWASRRNFLK